MSLVNLLKILNKNFWSHLFRKNRVYLCLSDTNQPTANSEHKKILTGSL